MKKLSVMPKRWVYVALTLVLILASIFWFRGRGEEYSYVEAVRENLRQEIRVSGKVKPVSSVSLSFEREGKVAALLTSVGEKVVPKEALIRLDSTSDELELREAHATRAADQALLSELERGTRAEDMAILESKLSSARSARSQALQELLDVLRDTFTKADDAVRHYADQFFDNPRSTIPKLNVQVNDAQLATDLSNSRRDLEAVFNDWERMLPTLSVENDLAAASLTSRVRLSSTITFLDKLALAVNTISPSQSLSAATMSSYRADVSTARTLLNTALTNLSAKEEGLRTALSDIDLATKNVDLARAGTAPEKIAAQAAKVQVDEATIAAVKHRIALSILRSPIAGTVSKQDARVGEVVSAREAVVSVVSVGELLIETFIPEIDIGAVALDQHASITFDAFPDETFEGRIVFIDPAETVIDGVSTYKVKVLMLTKDERIRSGMTVNLSLAVRERDHALALPAEAIVHEGDESFVLVALPKGVEKVPVSTGIRGLDGKVEILSGLDEHAMVAIPHH